MLPRSLRLSARIAPRRFPIPSSRLLRQRGFATPSEPPKNDNSQKEDDKGKQKEENVRKEDKGNDLRNKDQLPPPLEGFFKNVMQQMKDLEREAAKDAENRDPSKKQPPPPQGGGK